MLSTSLLTGFAPNGAFNKSELCILFTIPLYYVIIFWSLLMDGVGLREIPLFSIRHETYPLLERSSAHTRVCAKSPIILLLIEVTLKKEN